MKKKNKELIIYFISSALTSVLGFVLSILYSKMFSPSDYGIYSIAASTYNLVLNLYCGWITSAIIRCFQEYENKNKIDKFYGSFFQLQIILGIIFLIIPNIIIWNLNIDYLLKEIFCVFTIVYYFEESIAIINTMLRAKKEAKQYNTNTIINNMLKIIFVLVLYYVFNIENVIVIVLSLLMTEIIQYIYLFKKLHLKKYFNRKLFDLKIIKDMFKFGFPLIGVALTSWVLSTSDRYIIQYFFSSTEVGLYSYAYSLGNSLFNLLIQFIMLAAYPNIVTSWENEGREKTEEIIKYYLRLYMLIIIPSIVGVICVAKDFFVGFTDIRYHGSYIVFILTCISIAVLGLSQYTNKAWELTKRTNMILLLNLTAAIINIILNFIFIPKFGYAAAVVTTLISYLLYLIISLILSRKILTLKINYKSLLKVCISSAVMFLGITIFKRYVAIEVIQIKVILEVLIGIIIYGIMVFALKELNIKEIQQMITQFRDKVKSKNE